MSCWWLWYVESGPEYAHTLIQEMTNATLHGKCGFADVTKVTIFGWGHFPGLSGQALNVITSVLIKGRQRET